MTNAIIITSIAMLAFAANSILTRLALAGQYIDPAGFMAIRLLSGALVLVLLLSLSGGNRQPVLRAGSWRSALMLFAYAACFSWAYLSLSAGTGALILFAAVQITMIAAALLTGERPGYRAWSGYVLALAGMVYLLSPGLAAPPLAGSMLMVIAGIAWGLYSLYGRGVSDPLAVTTGNFILTVPMAALLLLLTQHWHDWHSDGVLLAIASGSLASGLGYAIWYRAVTILSTSEAASVQLSVPMLAAGGGVLFLAEPLSLRLLLASAMILGGLALVLFRQPDGN